MTERPPIPRLAAPLAVCLAFLSGATPAARAQDEAPPPSEEPAAPAPTPATEDPAPEDPAPTPPPPAPSSEATPIPLANADLEEGELGKAPTGWSHPTKDYLVELTDRNPLDGDRCVVLASPARGVTSPFGNLMQTIDARPWRGRWVKLRAAIRVEGAGAGDVGLLWMRVDREGGQRGFFDNMGDRPIVGRHWRYYEIEGEVAADATAINVGLMLRRFGRAWLDSVSLTDLGPFEVVPGEPAKALSDEGLTNIVAFTKLLGWVRYFHPSDEVARADWDAFAIEGIRAIEGVPSAKNPPALAKKLAELFAPVAPTVQVWAGKRKPPMPTELLPPESDTGLLVRTWRHRGVGGGGRRSIYDSWRVEKAAPKGTAPDGFPSPFQPFTGELGHYCSAMVPLSVYARDGKTLPKAPAAKPSEEPDDRRRIRRPSGDDRATRLAAVALAWNVFQHFYPYFDVVEVDWDAVLVDSLRAAAQDADARAFQATLRRLVAALDDGHGRVMHDEELLNVRGSLPLDWTWAEDSVVVTRVAEGVEGIAAGDVVESIDGRPVAELIAEAEELISSATPQWKRWRSLGVLLHGTVDAEVSLGLAGGRTATLKLLDAAPPEETRPEAVAEVRPGIFYVDLDRLTEALWTDALPKLAKAKGVVFDLRGYPGTETALTGVLSHLTKGMLTCAQWHVPLVSLPDRAEMTFEKSDWPVAPRTPHIDGKRAFITDGRAISAAETVLGIVEHYSLAEIVGGPTAGTNGNVNPFALPGGYAISWTGMKVLKHDGSVHHGVGIQPTIPVERTIAGIAAGKDELLEKAIAVVSEGSK